MEMSKSKTELDLLASPQEQQAKFSPAQGLHGKAHHQTGYPMATKVTSPFQEVELSGRLIMGQ